VKIIEETTTTRKVTFVKDNFLVHIYLYLKIVDPNVVRSERMLDSTKIPPSCNDVSNFNAFKCNLVCEEESARKPTPLLAS